jgi:hypothetical protein
MKKYQVFISSTQQDFLEERKMLIIRLLEAGFLPSAMEMFSASGNPPFDVIKKDMDLSDYYVLIIGFRYGSLTEEGISFTEKEYNYAIEKGIPVFAYIQDRDAPVSKSERELDPEMNKKLEQFIDKIEKNHTVKDKWKEKKDVINEIILTLAAQSNSPEVPVLGWYRFPTHKDNHEVNLNHLSESKACVFINALPTTSSEAIKRDAATGQYKYAIDESSKYFYWDIIDDFEIKNNAQIEEEHVAAIKPYIIDKISELNQYGLNVIYLFYAGPSGIAFHIGHLFKNVRYRIEVIQKSGNNYLHFGSPEK